MKRVPRSSPPVTLGPPDPNLTPRAGLHLVSEVDRVLGVAAALDAHIGPVKKRRRGLSAGEMVLSVAETVLGGGDFMCDLGNQRADTAGAPLRAVPDVPAATTFIGVAKRFGDKVFTGAEEAVAELVRRWFALLPEERRAKLASHRPTTGLDPADVVAVYHDIDKSRSLPWERRPQASRILRDLKDPGRGWDALVVAEPQRAFSGTQFEGCLFQFALARPVVGARTRRTGGHRQRRPLHGAVQLRDDEPGGAQPHPAQSRERHARPHQGGALARRPAALRLPHRRCRPAPQPLEGGIGRPAPPARARPRDRARRSPHLRDVPGRRRLQADRDSTDC